MILWEFFSLEKSSFSKHKTCLDKCFEEISLCLDVPLLEFLKIFSYTWDTKQHWFPYTWDTKQHWFRYTWDTMQHLQVLHATFRSGGTFYKNLYPSHSCIGNRQYICNAHSTAWETLWSQLFPSTILCLRRKSSTFSMSCSFWAASGWYVLC